MKRKFLFLFLLLSFFVIPKNTYALTGNETYEVNGTTYTIDLNNDTSVLDYMYFTYYYNTSFFTNNYNFTLIKYNGSYNFHVWSNSNETTYTYSNATLGGSPTTKIHIVTSSGSGNDTNCMYKGSNSTWACSNTNANDIYLSTILFSNYSFINNDITLFESNTSSASILERYIQEEPEEPTPPEEMSREEIYNGLQQTMYVGCLLLATLIIMLFFKWCFPFRSGGRKL